MSSQYPTLLRTPRRRARLAFTLMEMMLVLAVLVALAAMVWPSLTRPFQVEHLRKAADQVRTAWGKARVEAMSSGLVQVFRYLPESSDYAVQPWMGPDASLQASSSAAGPAATGGYGASPYGTSAYGTASATTSDKKLPEGILFLRSQTGADSRASAVEIAQPTDILFYPDGSTSDAQLVLGGENEEYVTIELYGMTGMSTVGEVLRQQRLGPEAEE